MNFFCNDLICKRQLNPKFIFSNAMTIGPKESHPGGKKFCLKGADYVKKKKNSTQLTDPVPLLFRH